MWISPWWDNNLFSFFFKLQRSLYKGWRNVLCRNSPSTPNRMARHWKWTLSSGSSPSLSLCRRVRRLRTDGWTWRVGSQSMNGFWSARCCFLLRSCPSGTRWATGALRSHTERIWTLPMCPDQDGWPLNTRHVLTIKELALVIQEHLNVSHPDLFDVNVGSLQGEPLRRAATRQDEFTRVVIHTLLQAQVGHLPGTKF